MEYTQDLPADPSPEDLARAEEHVRAHLSAVASADDDPETNADDVRVRLEPHEGGVRVIGTLEAEPVAPYLLPDFDPEEDVRANPLTVPSINDLTGGER